jgi:hypothetical protein
VIETLFEKLKRSIARGQSEKVALPAPRAIAVPTLIATSDAHTERSEPNTGRLLKPFDTAAPVAALERLNDESHVEQADDPLRR